MYYAMLAYHVESEVEAWSEAQDDALMDDLLSLHERMVAAKHFGPAARLGSTEEAKTLRGPGDGMVIDGPFAETKEQLLGLYVVDFPSMDEAIAAARQLRKVNPTAVYEIRPIRLYIPGTELEGRGDG